MLNKFVPQLRAQVQPHLPGEARARGAHKRAPALRSAPPREARERGRAGRVRGAGGGFEGARRAGGGVGEAVGEARAELLLGDVWARRWWASRVSRASQVWVRRAVAWRTAAAC